MPSHIRSKQDRWTFNPPSKDRSKNMLDFGQIVEKVSGLFEQDGSVGKLLQGNLSDLVQNANLDPSILETASLDQLAELLNQAGIDPTNLADGQIRETAQDLLQSGVLDRLDIGR
jgi:hypothetical protein